MNTPVYLLGLAGLGDTPNWLFLLVFSLVPFYLCAPLIGSGLHLFGTGIGAAVFQGLCLVALGWAAVKVYLSPKPPWFGRYLLFPIGYPIVTLTTNLGTAFISSYLGIL